MSVGTWSARNSSREVEVLRHRLADLVEQPPEVLGARSDPLVQLVHRRFLHELRGGPAHLALLGEHFGRDRVPPDMRRGDDELADLVRVLHGGEERDPAAERVADDVRLVEPEVVDERRDVVGHELMSIGRSMSAVRP